MVSFALKLERVNQDPDVRRVFDVMGLEEFLSVVATRSQATRALAAA